MVARYKSNDNLHSQRSKAHAPQQASIVAEGAKHAAYGQATVMELSSLSALNDFTMGGSVTGVAWSINPYLGCLHACQYCYVPETMHLERTGWGRYVTVKHNLPNVLRKELKTKPRLSTYLSTSTDAYQAPEREHEITRRCLKLLLKHDWPIDILTRSPLVLRDLDLLTRFTRVRIGLTVPTLDDEARRLIEPNAPPIPERLRALRRLSDAGIPTYANYSPAYPLTGGFTMKEVARAFKDAGIHWANTSHWRRVSTFLGPMWDRFHANQWKTFAQHVADPKKQVALRLELATAMKASGIPLSTGFFNPAFDLTIPYATTSQMKLEVETPPTTAPVVPPLDWGMDPMIAVRVA